MITCLSIFNPTQHEEPVLYYVMNYYLDSLWQDVKHPLPSIKLIKAVSHFDRVWSRQAHETSSVQWPCCVACSYMCFLRCSNHWECAHQIVWLVGSVAYRSPGESESWIHPNWRANEDQDVTELLVQAYLQEAKMWWPLPCHRTHGQMWQVEGSSPIRNNPPLSDAVSGGRLMCNQDLALFQWSWCITSTIVETNFSTHMNHACLQLFEGIAFKVCETASD